MSAATVAQLRAELEKTVERASSLVRDLMQEEHLGLATAPVRAALQHARFVLASALIGQDANALADAINLLKTRLDG